MEEPWECRADLMLPARRQEWGQTSTLGESVGMPSARKAGLGRLAQSRASGLSGADLLPFHQTAPSPGDLLVTIR